MPVRVGPALSSNDPLEAFAERWDQVCPRPLGSVRSHCRLLHVHGEAPKWAVLASIRSKHRTQRERFERT